MRIPILTGVSFAAGGLASAAHAATVTFTFEQPVAAVPMSPWTLALIVLAIGAAGLFLIQKRGISLRNGGAFALILALAAGASLQASTVEAQSTTRPLVQNTPITIGPGNNLFENQTNQPIVLATVSLVTGPNEMAFPSSSPCQQGVTVNPGNSCSIQVIQNIGNPF